jgi:tetratricopeptide (TPR) repeat protein
VLVAFDRFVDVLGPFVIAIAGVEKLSKDEVSKLLSFNRSDTKVILLQRGLLSANAQGCQSLDSEMPLTFEEALWLSEGRLAPAAVMELLQETGGAYELFLTSVRGQQGLPALWIPSPDGLIVDGAAEFTLDPRTLLEAVMKRKRYVEAFELACDQVTDSVRLIIDDCGEEFFARGMFEKFWTHLAKLPPATLFDEAILRWLYAAAMALNRHSEVVPLVERYLADYEAPELRAQYAASRPSRDFLKETSRAIASFESPITLRHHAFALSLEGRSAECLEVLQRALRLADLLGRDQLVVAIATDMAAALQRAGSLRESLWWGEWACAEYVNRGLNEQYRRMCALSALGFSKMLVDDDIGLAEIINELQISESLLGVPSYEGIASTVADYLMINGHQDRALQLYKAIHDAMPFEQIPFAAIDYVKCLCDVGEAEEGLQVAKRVVALSRGASEYQQNCARLAHGIAARACAVEEAVPLLREAAAAFADGGDAVKYAQASINLALSHLNESNSDAAHAEVALARPILAELGESGWSLLGGSDPRIDLLRSTVDRSSDGLVVRLLGPTSAQRDSIEVPLTDRQLDLLAVLLSNSRGCSLQEVAVKIYGDRAVIGTTKALISRLRSSIPLESRPYRLTVKYQADFLDLIEHLRRGRVRQALNLYRGPLLPKSEAPAVVELREHIDESLRQAVLGSGDAEAMIELANRTDASDLELLETALDHLSQNDPQSPLLRARIRQVRREWNADVGGNRRSGHREAE